MNTKSTSVSLKKETYDLMQTIRSCYQLCHKKTITYDEMVNTFLMEGLKAADPKVAQVMELVSDKECLNPPLEENIKKEALEGNYDPAEES